MRYVITRVFPLPAPASTSSGPSAVVTASIWGGLRVAGSSSDSCAEWVVECAGGVVVGEPVVGDAIGIAVARSTCCVRV